MSIETVAVGVNAVKAGYELARSFRDGLKSGTVKPDEIAGRIGEILDYLTDAKEALYTAQDEIRGLMRQIETHGEREALRTDLVFEEGLGIYTRASESKNPIPYCPVCWGAN